MFLPPAVIMMSFLRSTMRSSRPAGPSTQTPTSPLCSQPSASIVSRGDGLVLEVAAEHHVAADQDLAVVGQPQLDAGIRHADGSDGRDVAGLDRGGAGGFGQAVGLADRHAEHAKDTSGSPVRSARRRRSRRGNGEARRNSAASARPATYQKAHFSALQRAPVRARARPPGAASDAMRALVQPQRGSRRPRAAWSGWTEWNFSQMRGTPKKICGDSSRRSSCTVRRLSAKLTIGAGGHRDMDREHLLGDVAQRQVGDQLVASDRSSAPSSSHAPPRQGRASSSSRPSAGRWSPR